ncbi:C-type lectin domain family 2 member A-like isoform X2 [Oxyura jamaicensis]|uniref:C-type lectin domain family 2 member A-like isoform X2 n=1 Tax=Oxyura jamaicensis TaxID=8884 RepID=UPI0015A72A6E|nr:C-type lectin domain family 2 member A-like isoform X2 [Oxyura jamaicensis]
MAEALPDAGEDAAAAMMPPRRGAKEMTFSLRCLKDKLVPIGVTVLVAALLIAVIALAARKCPSCPSPILPSCSGNGIGFGEKCFYFVEDEADWNRSRSFCLSRRAQLATIDSREDLRFLLRYGRALHYWVGLQREGSDPWRWINGSLFNNLFDIRGNGQCAYINLDGVSSDWCSQLKYSVCSHPLKSPRGAWRGGEP